MNADDLTRRLAELPEDKRKLLQKVLADRGLAVPADTRPAHDAGTGAVQDRAGPRGPEGAVSTAHYVPGVTAEIPKRKWDWTDNRGKGRNREEYDSYHRKCNSTVFGEYSYFMNLGYVETDNRQYATVYLPPLFINRNSAKLALEVIGDCNLAGREILDVGCGRGGTLHLIQTFFRPRTTVGVDQSSEGIAFCNSTFHFANGIYVNGDAENLPFRGSSYDVVTNIESSHSYPNRHAFYREVFRVLRSGGYFLYSDLLPVEEGRRSVKFLVDLGFALERDQDISGNVLKSCEQSAGLQFGAFARHESDDWMADALGLPGSKIYEELKNGVTQFRIAKLRKA